MKINKFGYKRVDLCELGKQKKHSIHRLVSDAFIKKTKNGDKTRNFVNHKDGVKTNNYVSNLEWVTRKENAIHAYNMGFLKHINKKPRTEEERATIPVFRYSFKETCKRFSLNFEDFEEEFVQWKIRKDGYRSKQYVYKKKS